MDNQGIAARYRFAQARSGEIVPSLILPSGNNAPLHSMIDPKREAQRLILAIPEDCNFLIFLGLGGGFAPEAALAQTAAQVLVIDFDNAAIKELLSAKDYTPLLNNNRFSLLIDSGSDKIKNFILEHYNPALCGGIKVIPLRARTEHDPANFDKAAAVIQDAIESISADFSVQAHFGKRWFSNIIRNLKTCATANQTFAANNTCHKTAIVAAGPSLDQQMPYLAELKQRQAFIICSDTALPALFHHGIEPDAVVSIDCQHISYYHFLGLNAGSNLRNIPLFLDIASPPLLARLAPSPVFFTSGHPLAQYICQHWKQLPRIDTSGGNVTYACLSLAETLGAKHITLFGADFSNVRAQTYARGAYIYPFFEKKQGRLSPLEAQLSAFLYRAPFLPPAKQEEADAPQQNYYRETAQFRFYRKKFEEKAAAMNAHITAVKGQGAPIVLEQKTAQTGGSKDTSLFETSAAAAGSIAKSAAGIDEGSGAGSAAMFAAENAANIGSLDFLKKYRDGISALPEAKSAVNYHDSLNMENRKIFTTLLPLAAYFKRRNPHIKTHVLIEETKQYCIKEINFFLS